MAQVLIIVSATLSLALAIYLLSKFNRLFLRVRNPWLRKNLAVMLGHR